MGSIERVTRVATKEQLASFISVINPVEFEDETPQPEDVLWGHCVSWRVLCNKIVMLRFVDEAQALAERSHDGHQPRVTQTLLELAGQCGLHLTSEQAQQHIVWLMERFMTRVITSAPLARCIFTQLYTMTPISCSFDEVRMRSTSAFHTLTCVVAAWIRQGSTGVLFIASTRDAGRVSSCIC